MKKLLLVTSIVPVLLGLVANQAAAASSEVPFTPGSACRYYGAAATDSFFSSMGLSAIGMKNISASTKTLYCPLTFDSNHLPTFATILIKKPSAGAAAPECYMDSRDITTGVSAFTPPTTITTGQYAYIQFETSKLNVNLSWDAIAIDCAMPAGYIAMGYYSVSYF